MSALESRFEKLIASGFSILKFSQLPLPYQLAIAYYMSIDGDAWGLVHLDPRIYETEGLTAGLVAKMPAFVETYEDTSFGVLSLPTV